MQAASPHQSQVGNRAGKATKKQTNTTARQSTQVAIERPMRHQQRDTKPRAGVETATSAPCVGMVKVKVRTRTPAAHKAQCIIIPRVF